MVEADIRDAAAMDKVLAQHGPDAVMVHRLSFWGFVSDMDLAF
jgi:hypothetical protein